jgi:uncharacterized protein (DUF736 family)
MIWGDGLGVGVVWAKASEDGADFLRKNQDAPPPARERARR